MPQKKLSLIIVTYNSEKDIYDCLSSVFQYNDIGEALEIIIVDNCSRAYDPMRQKIQQLYGDKVTVVSNTKNGGYGQGNNVGIQLATASIIAIMNPDVRLIMPIFKKALETLEDKDTIMCGGKQFFSPESKAHSYYAVYTLPTFTRFLLNYVGIKRDLFFYRYMWLQGAFFFVRKKELDFIGGFDERIFMYGEEYDVHERLLRAFPKAKMNYLKECKYLHLAGERDFSPNGYEKLLRSLTYVMQKNGYSAIRFLEREKRYTKIAYGITNIANFIHHRSKRLPIDTALCIADKLINEYTPSKH